MTKKNILSSTVDLCFVKKKNVLVLGPFRHQNQLHMIHLALVSEKNITTVY